MVRLQCFEALHTCPVSKRLHQISTYIFLPKFQTLLSRSSEASEKNHKLYDCMTKQKIGKPWKKHGFPLKPIHIRKVATSPSQSSNSSGKRAVYSDLRPFTPSDEIEVPQRCVKCSDGGKVVAAGHRVQYDDWKWKFYEFLHCYRDCR